MGAPCGLIPVFRTEPDTIFVFRKVWSDVEEQAHRSADDCGGQADGSRLLGREGEQVNHKRVHRIYREAGLALRRKKRKHCMRVRTPLGVYTAPNQEWALDFVHDAVASGRSIPVLNVIDAFTRESLAMEVDTSVTRVLDQIIAERGLPRAIRCDNGPELTSRHFLAWALDRKIDLVHIQPGKPTQNAYVESFNSKMREECLRVSWFQNLFEARRIIAAWRRDYNERRPHSSLNYMTPSEFAAKASGGKDAGQACLKNDTAAFHFPTATAAAS